MDKKMNKSWKNGEEKMTEILSREEEILSIQAENRVDNERSILSRINEIDGLVLDLSVNDTDGMPWDFSKQDKRRRARNMVLEKRALLILGSPMCVATKIMQEENGDSLEIKRERTRKHLEYCMEIYNYQNSQNRRILCFKMWLIDQLYIELG